MDSRPRPAAAEIRSYADLQPLFEWVREEEADTLLVDATGFRKEHLKVQVDTLNNLRVSGERQLDGNRWSRFSKVFPLPENCKVDDIHAKFEDGLLYVMMPKNIIPPRVEPKDQQPTKTQEAPPPPTRKAEAAASDAVAKSQKAIQDAASAAAASAAAAKKPTSVSERVEPKDQQSTKTQQAPPPPPPPSRKAEAESKAASDAAAQSQKITTAAASVAAAANAAAAAAANAVAAAAAAGAKKQASVSERIGALKEELKKKVGKEEGSGKAPADLKEGREKITLTGVKQRKEDEVFADAKDTSAEETGKDDEKAGRRRVLRKFKYEEKPGFVVVLNVVAAVALIVGVGVYLTSKLRGN